MLLVYRYRIKSLIGLLNSQARACNFVWNFCNDTQQQALKWNKRWPSGFDLNRLTAGTSKSPPFSRAGKMSNNRRTPGHDELLVDRRAPRGLPCR
jgi:hypothetical protein